MVILESEYLEAADVAELADKKFIIAKGAYMHEFPQIDGTMKRKVVVPVKLSNDKVKPWIPNKTSEKKLKAKHGKDTDKWIGKAEEFELIRQNVRGEMKDVIFVK